MKKILCALLCALLLLSALTLVSCDKEPETLKFGLGVYTDVTKADSATEDADGQGNVAITAAAVTVDADGKIVSCVLDTADITVKYTAEGKAVANESFKTKYEMGADYGMVAYAGSAKEWFEQADAFMALVKGKTLAEVKALVADGNKGTDEVINAGCTITISDFVLAIEKAYNNAADSNATAENTLKLGIYTEQTCKDATEDAAGQNKVETTLFAAAVDADGKVVAASSDCAQIVFGFDAAGASTYDLTKAAQTKKEQGDNYGMVAYAGAAKEWYAQAAAFDAACIGKTASEIAGLMGSDNYGNADLKAAGCTVLVNGFVKAAEKIGK
ncbi:MAG: hypothetical protein IJW70_05530 [Clostridia bacterium]|nr:hypothetical protein [Clostridia bacterium]